MTDEFGTISRDWITTVDDDNWLIYLNNGQTISVARTDYGIEVHHVEPSTGVVTDFEGTPFPYRAGAMEAVRRWLDKNQLIMVPSPEQAAQPWHGWSSKSGEASAIAYDHSYRAKYDAARVVSHADAASNDTGFDNGRDHPTPAVNPLELAKRLNAMLAPSEPPPNDPTSPEAGAGYYADEGAFTEPEPDPLDIAARLNRMLGK